MEVGRNYRKVMLISPPGKIFVRPDGALGERKHCTPPLGLAYISAGLLARGYEVCVLDALAEGYENEIYDEPFIIYGLPIDVLLQRVEASAPDVVGISLLFSSRAKEAFEIALAIKGKLPNVKIVMGGQHPSAMPRESLGMAGVDFVLCGEADHTMPDLLDALNGSVDITTVNGLYYYDQNGDIISNDDGKRAIVSGGSYNYYSRKDAAIPLDLNGLPRPAWHLINMEAYWTSAVRIGGGDMMREKFAVMMSTRGCPHTCYFCTSPLLSGYKAYRRRDNDNVVDEIRWLYDDYGIREVQFLDDNFFVSVPRVKALCKRLAEEFPDMVFGVPAGAEVNALDDELIELLAKANFHKIVLAIEAADQEIQNEKIDKCVQIHRVPEVIRKIRDNGMTVLGLLMIGFPGETAEQIKKTIDLALSLDFDDFFLSIVTPLPGTPLYDECLEKGLIEDTFDPNNLRYSYSNIKLPDVTKEAIESARREAWLKMKQRGERHTGTMRVGACKEFNSLAEYENAGLSKSLLEII